MVMRVKVFLLTFFIAANFIFPQGNSKINEKQAELSKIKDEISSLENEIKEKSHKEKESADLLEVYNKQNYLLNKLINNLKEEERQKQHAINKSERKIESLKDDIEVLKKNYAKYLVAIYKYGKVDELSSIIDASSVGQMLRRYKYLQEFSTHRKKDLNKLKNKIKELNNEKIALKKEKKEKQQLVKEKQGEEKNLVAKLNTRKKIIEDLRKDKKELRSQLVFKRKAETQIKDLITKLVVEEERRKREAELLVKENSKSLKNENNGIVDNSNTTENYDVDLSTSGFESFSSLKGKLNWPVRNGHVVRKFGENRNQKLNTVTINYGVDIKVPSEEEVKAVADGVVSAIEFIAGYGSVIIITHKSDYRTVYSHLSEIYVSEGDKVKRGTLIARVGETLEGNILHFEIWNSRINQNPEIWLVKK